MKKIRNFYFIPMQNNPWSIPWNHEDELVAFMLNMIFGCLLLCFFVSHFFIRSFDTIQVLWRVVSVPSSYQMNDQQRCTKTKTNFSRSMFTSRLCLKRIYFSKNIFCLVLWCKSKNRHSTSSKFFRLFSKALMFPKNSYRGRFTCLTVKNPF